MMRAPAERAGRGAIVRLAWGAGALVVGAFLLGAAADGGREQGITALRLEFARDGISAPRASLDARYEAACDAGWKPACEPTTWRPEGRSDLAAAGRRFEDACGQGDPAACTVVGWASDAEGRAGESDSVAAFRRAARLWKTACDNGGFLPACHEYAGLLYENRGVQADPLAGVLRWAAACDKGDAASCASAATVYAAGSPSVKLDAKSASKYADKGCALGSPAACGVQHQLQPPADPIGASADLCARGLRATCVTLAGQEPAAKGSPAYGWLATACDLGDGASCARVGTAARNDGDAAGAEAAWVTGCYAGDRTSCTELGAVAVADRAGVVARAPQLRAACMLGDVTDACTVLGTAMLEGRVPRDADASLAMLTRGCTETAGAAACAALGSGYASGAIGERDRTLAVRYYGQACGQGDLAACELRGDLLVEGVGVRRDDTGALQSYERACTGGRADACYKGGRVLDEGTQIAQDSRRALDLYAAGCEKGSAQGCYGQGLLLEQGVGGDVDHAGARAAYTRAADAGLKEAKAALSRILWNGLGAKRQRGKARDLAAEACQAGDRPACGGPSAL